MSDPGGHAAESLRAPDSGSVKWPVRPKPLVSIDVVHVCLVLPAATGDVHELIQAIRRHHPSAVFGAVWAGDPHRRPSVPDGVVWLDEHLDDPSGAGWNRLMVAAQPDAFAVALGASAVARHLRGSGEPTLMLRVGSVAVTGSLDELVPATGIAVIERLPQHPPDDGLAPSLGDLAIHGRFGVAAIGFGGDAADTATAIAAAIAAGSVDDRPGALADLAVGRSGCAVHHADGALVLGWGVAGDSPVTLIDLDQLDRDEPWHVAFGDRQARLRLADEPVTADVLDATVAQWGSPIEPVTLPGRVEVDQAIRNLASAAIDGWRRDDNELPPEPFGADGSAFVEWLETPWPPWGPDIGRYWSEVRRLRPDLVGAFPEPAGADHDAFVEWAENSWKFDGRSPVIRSGAHAMRPAWHERGREGGGINLVGYLGFDKSLGDVARRIHRSLAAAAVPVAALHYHRSGSPISSETPELADGPRYDTNLIVINADQMHLVDADYGPELFDGRYTVAYWFWELAHVPSAMVRAMRFVDEVWVATDFTADAFRAVTDKPVRTVPVPVPEPTTSDATRGELGMPEGRFVFLVTLDHLSVTERKNPVAAVEAFRLAFPDTSDDGPVLVVKTLNREHRWAEHERIRVAAAGRSDIVVTDRHLTRPDQMALTAAADCLVSLHRAEGLGLHLMEAMWLGTPTIATRYSGNLHFMTDDNSALVDAQLVPVVHGEQYFPPEAEWADPDLDQAATWMRRVFAEPQLVARLSDAGRARMHQQPGLAETGHTIAHLSRVARDGGST